MVRGWAHFQSTKSCKCKQTSNFFVVLLLHRPHCADCYWQLSQHTIHTIWERCPAGMTFDMAGYHLNFPLVISLYWLWPCGRRCALIMNSLLMLAFSGVWPWCWWTVYESCGNYVTKLHCCSCWKHSPVSLSFTKHKYFVICLLLFLLIEKSNFLPLQDNWSFCFQTNCPDLCDW